MIEPNLSQMQPGRWLDGQVAGNIILGEGTIVSGDHCFHRFRSKKADALKVGRHCSMEGVHFALGEDGRVVIGDHCVLSNALLMCELEIRIGNYVMMGWNSTIADSDFHPISPGQRIADSLACSPLAEGRPRPAIAMRPVIIEDDVWIGPNATILKGVRIGAGSFIEPGALVTREVPPRSRVIGNPAQVVGTL
jgi:acetyltransferase-like isoleucine patch superfamily enzyme